MRRHPKSRSAFTLMEVLLASFAAAILLAALYGLFARAIKLRDSATQHLQTMRLQSRALSVLRQDLANARRVGTEFSGTFDGSETSDKTSTFRGYLRFTTTTGRDTEEELHGDTQEVEYYIAPDERSAENRSGVLVRTVDRVLLAESREITSEERLLTGLESMELEFYDGSDWTTTWQATETTSAMPKAVRVTLRPYVEDRTAPAPPLELFVNLAMQPATTTVDTATTGGSGQ